MHLTLARASFYQKHSKLFSVCYSLEVSLGLPSTTALQLVTFLAQGCYSRLSESRSQHQPGTYKSVAQIFKFLHISIHRAVDLCPSSYDTEVANVVIPVELISD